MGKKSKLIKIIAISVVAAAAIVVALSFLFKGRDIDLTGNICYSDRYVYSGKNNDFSATVYAGAGEKNFLTDGQAVDVTGFCKISLNIINMAYNKLTSFGFELKTDTQSFSGTITKDSLSSELSGAADVPDPSKIRAVIIKYGDKNTEIGLADVLDGRLSAGQAYDAALKVFAKEIKSNLKNGSLNREIYIKFVTGYGGEEPYYWYVAFIASDSDYWAVLLDSKTGAVDVRRG
jgi:hypothetical protein